MAATLNFRAKRRIASPEPRHVLTAQEPLECADSFGEGDEEFYDESGGSFISAIFWKLLLPIVWVFKITALLVSIAVWTLIIVVSFCYSFVRWCFTLHGLLFLIPALLGVLIYGIFAALDDRGTASPLYRLIEEHHGNLTRILEEVELTAETPMDKTLGGGLLARRSALELAATRGYTPLLQNLLKHGKAYNSGWSFGPRGSLGSAVPLAAAALNGHSGAVEVLLEAGAPADVGCSYGPFEMLGSSTALAGAAQNGHVPTIQLLLKANASVDAGWSFGLQGIGWRATPLRAAAWSGHSAAVEVLLRAGAPADAGISVGPFGLIWSDTPLMGAAWNGDLRSVQALLAAGASLEYGAGEELRKAAFLGHMPVVKVLLEAGASDKTGKAMQGAFRNGHDDIAKVLKDARGRSHNTSV